MLYMSSTLTRDPHLKTYTGPASLHWTTMLTFSLAVRGCVSTCGTHHPIMIWWWGCLPLYNMLCHFIPNSFSVFHKLLLVNQPYWSFYCQEGNNKRCQNWVVSHRFLLCATYTFATWWQGWSYKPSVWWPLIWLQGSYRAILTIYLTTCSIDTETTCSEGDTFALKWWDWPFSDVDCQKVSTLAICSGTCCMGSSDPWKHIHMEVRWNFLRWFCFMKWTQQCRSVR